MSTVSTPTFESGKKFVPKPEKPDQAEFEKNLKAAQQEHDKVRQKLNEVKAELDLVQTPGKNFRQNELREQLNKLRDQQTSSKNDRNKLEEQIKNLDASIKAKIKEQNAQRGKVPYKTVEELDRAIKERERSVEKGDLRLVDERKTLSEISSLQKQRKNFGAFEIGQKAIDDDKRKLDELRQKKKDPNVQKLNEEYDAIRQELDEIKASQDEAFGNLNKLRDERSALYDQQQEKWEAIQTLKDDYYRARNAFRDYEKEAWRIRKEKKAKEDEEFRQARKRQLAQQKMEEASEKAYTAEILTCEGLIGFFDPSSAEAARKAKLISEPRALAAQPARAVDDTNLAGTRLIKKDDREEDYFIGKPKKGKKGKKNAGATASPASESSPATPFESDSGKINLAAGVLQELSKVDIPPPGSKEDVQRVLKTLNEKLDWYKANQEKKTKENIAKAQREIDHLEADGSRDEYEEVQQEGSNGTSTPSGEKSAEPAVEEDVEGKEEKVEEKAE